MSVWSILRQWVLELYLEDRDCGPEQRVKVLPLAAACVRVTELTAEQVHAQDTEQRDKNCLQNEKKTVFICFLLPEDEDKEHQQAEEDGDIIHGPQHDNQRSLEVGKEPHHLDDPQQSEGSEDSKAQTSLSDAVVIFTEQLESSFRALE